jgi:hypothetical protein
VIGGDVEVESTGWFAMGKSWSRWLDGVNPVAVRWNRHRVCLFSISLKRFFVRKRLFDLDTTNVDGSWTIIKYPANDDTQVKAGVDILSYLHNMLVSRHNHI